MIKHSVFLVLPLTVFASIGVCYSNDSPLKSETRSTPAVAIAEVPLNAADIALRIKRHYENELYQLPPSQAGHFTLRMYRQTLDPKYQSGIQNDMVRIANKLNYFANEINTPEAIYIYSQEKLANYKNSHTPRAQLRYAATKHTPQYLYAGIELLAMMARLDDYGLKHQDDDKLRNILHQYNFARYVTNRDMIKAWAAQLANQVFWLRQLGEKDYIAQFIHAFKLTYPDKKDSTLDRQQYENKLYGMTHIILADSGYYQQSVSEHHHQWIYDYFRQHIDTIILRAKADILSEIGISFLLAGLDQDPVVAKCRKAIIKKFDKEQNMIPSIAGKTNLVLGEHRNVLATMLLDWKGVHPIPTLKSTPDMFRALPYGLVDKHTKTNSSQTDSH